MHLIASLLKQLVMHPRQVRCDVALSGAVLAMVQTFLGVEVELVITTERALLRNRLVVPLEGEPHPELLEDGGVPRVLLLLFDRDPGRTIDTTSLALYPGHRQL